MKKEKRHSIQETMKKNLRKEYFYLKKELLFYCPIDLGTFSRETYYATFDKEGISVYQYDKTTESKLKLRERHLWKSWDKVKIDHYLTTSQFVFQGKRNWILSLFHKGKEAQKIIKEHTSLQTEVVSRSFLKKLPGFRSNTTLNKYIGSICYTALIAFLLKWIIPFQVQVALYSFSIGCMLLGLLCFTIGLIEPTIVLFRTKEKTRTKVFYYYSYLAISGFICVFIFW
ncbi:hypothetical protein COM13_03115 [Bacillus pseudomycoides]|uniref:Group-specific protein n=2 Tax=Bacillus pseudomycoides TaxID=64104 RepID=A0ABD6TC55_9BACI|nr:MULTISPECIES: hypothetical protein [Bacillus]EEM11920.1 hypothetical protein bmyco0003_12770 [Bacillus pseudomycoides]EEM17714.1 hypothetical protein bpmyx0001_13520 [Bacillus pseudomycoides DSM 12442]KFN15576.1 hypothetical protein DJ94_3143 [Bacillus pseudomycoides]MBJ8027690.1 hypothetical protein [Bacillus cereus group sp. N21]MCR8856314.1 hypothetical protein [Bacillus pseudomycoides]